MNTVEGGAERIDGGEADHEIPGEDTIAGGFIKIQENRYSLGNILSSCTDSNTQNTAPPDP